MRINNTGFSPPEKSKPLKPNASKKTTKSTSPNQKNTKKLVAHLPIGLGFNSFFSLFLNDKRDERHEKEKIEQFSLLFSKKTPNLKEKELEEIEDIFHLINESNQSNDPNLLPKIKIKESQLGEEVTSSLDGTKSTTCYKNDVTLLITIGDVTITLTDTLYTDKQVRPSKEDKQILKELKETAKASIPNSKTKKNNKITKECFEYLKKKKEIEKQIKQDELEIRWGCSERVQQIIRSFQLIKTPNSNTTTPNSTLIESANTHLKVDTVQVKFLANHQISLCQKSKSSSELDDKWVPIQLLAKASKAKKTAKKVENLFQNSRVKEQRVERSDNFLSVQFENNIIPEEFTSGKELKEFEKLKDFLTNFAPQITKNKDFDFDILQIEIQSKIELMKNLIENFKTNKTPQNKLKIQNKVMSLYLAVSCACEYAKKEVNKNPSPEKIKIEEIAPHLPYSDTVSFMFTPLEAVANNQKKNEKLLKQVLNLTTSSSEILKPSEIEVEDLSDKNPIELFKDLLKLNEEFNSEVIKQKKNLPLNLNSRDLFTIFFEKKEKITPQLEKLIRKKNNILTELEKKNFDSIPNFNNSKYKQILEIKIQGFENSNEFISLKKEIFNTTIQKISSYIYGVYRVIPLKNTTPRSELLGDIIQIKKKIKEQITKLTEEFNLFKKQQLEDLENLQSQSKQQIENLSNEYQMKIDQLPKQNNIVKKPLQMIKKKKLKNQKDKAIKELNNLIETLNKNYSIAQQELNSIKIKSLQPYYQLLKKQQKLIEEQIEHQKNKDKKKAIESPEKIE